MDTILALLRKHKLYASPKKCEFFKTEIDFLGFRLSSDGIATDDHKIRAVRDWVTPTTVKEVRAFLGLAGFYRKFVRRFAHITAPLTDLTKKDQPFIWGPAQETAFNEIKTALTTAPVLLSPDPDLPFTVDVDASDYAIGAALMQDHGNGLQPVAFESRKMLPAETRYPTHERETLAIIHALKTWRCYLESRHTTTLIVTDHKTLQGFQDQQVLNKRQTRWMELMQQYNFKVEYRQGKQHVVADALSRLTNPPEAKPDADDYGEPDLSAIEINAVDYLKPYLPLEFELEDELRNASAVYANHPNVFQAHGLYFLKCDQRGARLCIPPVPTIKRRILYEHHDVPAAGHLGRNKTTASIKRLFYWPNMDADIKEYVRTCDVCQRTKARTRKEYGLLQPLPIPSLRWDQVSMDFITQLPRTKTGYDAIFVVVDRLSKMAHFVPTHTTADAATVARLFLDNVFRLHGLPSAIVSDRDSRFTGQFWQQLFKALGTKLQLSTAYHPQTDGQTERTNRTLEQILRAYTNHQADDWDVHLSAAEFAYNDSVNASTGFTPFVLHYGQDPATPAQLFTRLLQREHGADHEYDMPAVHTILHNLDAILNLVRDNLLKAQRRQAFYADRRRQEQRFNVGDQVLLERRNPPLKGHKFDDKYHGPFEVLKVVSPVAYKIKLPDHWSIHPVFHVSLLRPYYSDDPQFEDTEYERVPAPPPVTLDQGEALYDVAAILDKRYHGRGKRLQYLVSYVGMPSCENQWLDKRDLRRCPELIAEFERRTADALPAPAKRGRGRPRRVRSD